MNWVCGIILFAAGGAFGVVTMCLMFVAKESDRQMENMNISEKDG